MHTRGVRSTPLYDSGESFDATDTGDDVVPPGTAAILFAAKLEDLAAAGFRRDPDDPTGAKLGDAVG